MGEKRKALVVFYSRTGVTRKVAGAIAAALKCDSEEILDTKDRGGFGGWLAGGKDATLKSATVIKDMRTNPAAYDLVIIGTPVWAWTMTPAVRTYLQKHKPQLKEAAFFCTMGSSGDKGALGAMTEISGKTPLATLAINQKEFKSGAYQSKVAEFVGQLLK